MIKNRLLRHCLFCFFGFILVRPAQARLFRNSYIQFQLPHKWACELRNRVWICRYEVSVHCKRNVRKASCKKQIRKSKEALAVFTAREAGQVDSLKAYFEAFKNPRELKKSSGKTSQSRVIHTKTVSIKNQKWVDGMHLGSEIPHYYTRYLATVKGDVAVLVTFSAHKLFYTGYSGQFFRAVNSLEIITSRVSGIRKNELGHKVLSRPIDIPDEIFTRKGGSEDGEDSDRVSTFLFFLAIVMMMVGIYIWFRGNRRS